MDLWRGRLSYRKLQALVGNLPQESATVRAISGDVADWTTDRELLAATVDRLNDLIWLTVEVNKKPRARNPRPDPVPRPTERHQIKPAKTHTRRQATVAEMKQFFGRR